MRNCGWRGRTVREKAVAFKKNIMYNRENRQMIIKITDRAVCLWGKEIFMRKAGKILMGAAGAAAAAGYGVIRYLYNMAFEREILQETKPYGQGTEYEETILEGKQWLADHGRETVCIQSFDNLCLKAHYIAVPDAKRTVIMFHGWRGTWDYDFAPTAKWFHDTGCNLLLIEERAQGESEGKYISFGLLERRDCLSWVDWLNREYSPERIYLYGVSMGAATVLMASGSRTLPENVAGVIADCGYTTPYDILHHTAQHDVRMPEHPSMDVLNYMCRRRMGVDLKEYSTLDAMKTIKVPALFIHGEADKFVPCEMTIQNYAACRSPKKLLLVEDAGHCMSFLVHPDAYKAAVEEFFAEIEKEQEAE